MSILDIFTSKVEGKITNIGIGLGDSEAHNLKILKATIKLLEINKSSVYFFGNKSSINQISKNTLYKKNSKRIFLIDSNEPESEILNYLGKELISCVVRGSLGSSKFLQSLKTSLNISEIARLALLETYKGQQFFFGPVGIDECNNIKNKKIFLEKAIKILEALNLKPKISILSGGRVGDLGRNPDVDKTINEAKELVDYFKLEHPKLEINHTEILIEKAINDKSNLILAPNGISGNLIYRTLVHLGGGKAYGAIYMDIGHIIIDTSRVGDFSEIYGGFILALALTH
ncbi:MAG: methyltransferase [Promethearchaeota archaeon Loki_b31]|nr:MAG: methyltransferase [Candidatus Lokiarchaeota archaeon Loki_b31]